MKPAYQWIPTLYILEGLPFAFVTTTSMILYKNFNISNTKIAFYTSLFTIPWFLKPLIAPTFEGLSKRMLVLTATFAFMLWITLLALSIPSQHFFLISIVLFFCLAITSSIYDMNADGLYISQLDPKTQARFIGIRTVSYHIGRLIAQGGIIYLASYLFISFGVVHGWQIAFILLAAIMLLFFIYHFFVVPKEKMNVIPKQSLFINFRSVLTELMTIPMLKDVLIFTLIYNFAENQLIKIVPLFLLDHFDQGGLNLTTSDVSLLIGGFGILGMLIGILASGFILTKVSLRYILIPATSFAILTNVTYLLLSLFQPHSFLLICMVMIVSQIGYGFSNGIYMYYLLHTFGKSIYSMSLYAIGTAIMGLGVMLGGAISGWMQSFLGYTGFFSWILVSGLLVVLYSYYLIKKDFIPN